MNYVLRLFYYSIYNSSVIIIEYFIQILSKVSKHL